MTSHAQAPAGGAPALHGVIARFRTPQDLLHAIEAARADGWTSMDAYTPYPVEAVFEALGHHHSKVPLLTLIGGLAGAAGGFSLCYWSSVIEYPLNVGGRPFFSWPAWIPVTFECAVLFGGLTAVIGMIALNGLPQPYHPVFGARGFEAASRDGYFLCIEATDPRFEPGAARAFLAEHGALDVSEVIDDAR